MNIENDYYSGKTILVTGGAGAIGSNLCARLADLNAQVVIIDDLSSSERWNVPSHKNILFVQGSIIDEIMLKRVFFEKPQIVFHLAAFFANQNSVDHPESDLFTNGLGTLKLLEYCTLSKVDRFIYSSSGASFYDEAAPLPLKENVITMHLATPYQITKMMGELYCNFFHSHHEIPVVKTRFFNSYGPGEIPGQYRNVIPNFIYWAMKGQALPITGTGEETRDLTYVEDLVDGLLLAAECKEAIGMEINLASSKETRIIDLAHKINELTGNKSEIHYLSRRLWDTKSRRLASIERAQRVLGYEPKTELSQGLVKTIEWFRKNWSWIEGTASFVPGMSSAVRGVVAVSGSD